MWTKICAIVLVSLFLSSFSPVPSTAPVVPATADAPDPNDPTDAYEDYDHDGLTNLEESLNGTDPTDPDTDDDDMPDGWEVYYGLDPLDPSDASGNLDATSNTSYRHTHPHCSLYGTTTTGDSWTNLDEYLNDTIPTDPDSDGDGIPDCCDPYPLYPGDPTDGDWEGGAEGQWPWGDGSGGAFLVFTAAPARPARYWRVACYDSYSGRSWSQSSRITSQNYSGETLSTEVTDYQTATSTDYTVAIRPGWTGAISPSPLFCYLINNSDGYLAAPLHTTTMDPVVPSRNMSNDTMQAFQVDGGVNGYEVTTTYYEYGPGTLENATVPSTGDLQSYLELPGSIPSNVRTLALSITQGESSPYNKAKLIENYLLTNYNFSFNATPLPSHRDRAEWFLFYTKEGTHLDFVSAFVVLCRYNQLPTRYVAGYMPGVDKGSHVAVYSYNVSAWAEVYFEGPGWVEFDPVQSKPPSSGGGGDSGGNGNGGGGIPGAGEDRVMFWVEPATNPRYWRMTAFDDYTGSRWRQTEIVTTQYGGERIPTEVTQNQSADEYTYKMTINGTGAFSATSDSIKFNNGTGGYIPEALHTTQLYNIAPAQTIYNDSVGAFSVSSGASSYEFDAISYAYSPSMLANATSASQATYPDLYYLPSSIPARVQSLALAITGGEQSPYIKAMMLVDYLKLNYNCTLNASAPSSGHDIVDWFLFESRAGKCTEFAAAFVVLCRYNHIPARYVVGYAPGAIENDKIAVYSSNAHAWPEVRFETLGWLEFEPTPPGSGSGNGGGGGGGGNGGGNGGEPPQYNETVLVLTEIEPLSSYKGSIFTAAGNVMDKNSSEPIANMPVSIYVNESSDAECHLAASGYTNDTGVFSVVCPVPNAIEVGQNVVTAYAHGLDLGELGHRPTWSNKSLSMKIYSNTSVMFDVPEYVINHELLSISGTLIDAGNVSLADEVITVYWGVTELDSSPVTTDANGAFNISRRVADTAGPHNIQARFTTASPYLFSSSTNATVIVKQYTRVLVTQYWPKIFKGESFVVIGSVLDENDSFVENASITIYVNETELGYVSATARSNDIGMFRAVCVVPNELDTGMAALVLSTADTEYHLGNWTELPEVIGVYSNTVLILESLTTIVNEHNLTIRGALMDAGGIFLDAKAITLKWDDITLPDITTSNGSFVLVHRVNDSAGPHDLSAFFIPTCIYLNGSNADITVIVQHHVDLTCDLEPDTVVVGAHVDISGLLVDDWQLPLSTEDPEYSGVSITLDGVLLNLTMPDASGQFSYTYPVPLSESASMHTLDVEFPGSAYYLSSSTTLALKVKRTTTLDMSSKTIVRDESVNASVEGRLLDNMGVGLRGLNLTVLWDETHLADVTTSVEGAFAEGLRVNATHPLGPVEVDVSFAGSGYYTTCTANVTYYVKDRTTLTLHPETYRRNAPAMVTGTLENIYGQALVAQSVELQWNNVPLGKAQTDSNGDFALEYLIPPTHELGTVNVAARFNETLLYLECNATAVCRIVANCTLALTPQEVLRNTIVHINGELHDDAEAPVIEANISLYWRGRFIGAVETTQEGTFTLPYFIGWEQPLGEVNVTAKLGDERFKPLEETVVYVVTATTAIELERITTLIRGKAFELEGGLLSDDGTGVAQETLLLTLCNHTLGNVSTTATGEFVFASIVPGTLDSGLAKLYIWFNGTSYLRNVSYEHDVTVKAHTVLALSVPSKLNEGEKFKGTLLLKDDNNVPIGNATVIVRVGDEYIQVTTDKTGKAVFTAVANETVYAFYSGNASLLPSNASAHILYRAAPSVVEWYVYVLPAVAIVCSAFLLLALYVLRRKHQLIAAQQIIREAKEELIAGNEYIATIFNAYKRLCAHLRRYGFLKKDAETVREFENAVRKALPLDHANLDTLLRIFEEARYSSHDIGPEHRDKAIASLKAIEDSLQKLIAQEGEALAYS